MKYKDRITKHIRKEEMIFRPRKQNRYTNYFVLPICMMLFFYTSAYSQMFKNLTVSQNDDTVKIHYDIWGCRPDAELKIHLRVSPDGGSNYSIIPKSVYGDIGNYVASGQNKIIIWMPLKDSIQLNGDNYVFNLNGSVTGDSGNIEMVSIKGGIFKMGDQFGEGNTDETYIHSVKLNDFKLSAYEITNIQFAAFLKTYGSDKVKSGEFAGEPMIYASKNGLVKKGNDVSYLWDVQPGKAFNPVVGITWYGAYEFCRFYNYKLPSEAEWEYAAREAGRKIRFGNGKNSADISEIKFNGNSKILNDKSAEGNTDSSTVRIGIYKPNSLGLYDMSGNVWEYCQDWYKSNYYLHSRSHEPVGPWLGKYKVIRGGSWFSSAFGIRTTVRSFIDPHYRKEDVGFRVAKNVIEKSK